MVIMVGFSYLGFVIGNLELIGKILLYVIPQGWFIPCRNKGLTQRFRQLVVLRLHNVEIDVNLMRIKNTNLRI